MFENRKYAILDSSEVDNIDFSKVIETSKDTLRYNLDGTKTFVKWEGETPAFLVSPTIYTRVQILEILNNIENGWYNEE